MEAAPIEDEDKVDERRKSLGLEPLEKYLRSLEEMYINPQKKEPKGNDKKP